MEAGHQLAGRYQFEERLGRGGTAEVWRARDEALNRDVAVKVLSTELSHDPTVVERFRREARAAASLNHPNIVAVYDTGSEDELHYTVMELVDGPSLRGILADTGPLDPDRALAITAQIAEALAVAHQQGIVHRDVKPANVMFAGDWMVKVADFGIARIVTAATQVGQEAVFGSIPYVAPEQARGDRVDARADLYALGCVLFELLTGRPPFTGDAPVAVIHQHLHVEPPAPSSLRPDVPPELDAVVAHLLRKDPTDRYATAEQLLDDLDRVTAGQRPLLPTAAALDDAATVAIPRVAEAASIGPVVVAELDETRGLTGSERAEVSGTTVMPPVRADGRGGRGAAAGVGAAAGAAAGVAAGAEGAAAAGAEGAAAAGAAGAGGAAAADDHDAEAASGSTVVVDEPDRSGRRAAVAVLAVLAAAVLVAFLVVRMFFDAGSDIDIRPGGGDDGPVVAPTETSSASPSPTETSSPSPPPETSAPDPPPTVTEEPETRTAASG